ncbi:MAG: (2Fe-2S) ferredoxin domain-containing protein [Anaerolineae bacterium]|nr:(2Fe-2S) ferredoxin domain-containing protein [Anaerolineae bacterium]
MSSTFGNPTRKLANVEELRELGEAAKRQITARRATGTTIYVGMGTCGIAAGARATLKALTEELARHGIEADIETVGCIGICVKEPLVDIQQAGKPRITYGNVTPDMVPRIVEEHLMKGIPVKQWVVGRLESI